MGFHCTHIIDLYYPLSWEVVRRGLRKEASCSSLLQLPCTLLTTVEPWGRHSVRNTGSGRISLRTVHSFPNALLYGSSHKPNQCLPVDCQMVYLYYLKAVLRFSTVSNKTSFSSDAHPSLTLFSFSLSPLPACLCFSVSAYLYLSISITLSVHLSVSVSVQPVIGSCFSVSLDLRNSD